MKKNILILAALVIAGVATLTLSNLRAQTQPAAPGASVQPMPMQGSRPMPPRGRMMGLYRHSIQMLNMIKTDLERSTDDYNGHRQSAIDACTKAAKELEAVQAAMAADAAKAAQPQTPPPASAPAPASH